jgi:histidinol dehydrogenase
MLADPAGRPADWPPEERAPFGVVPTSLETAARRRAPRRRGNGVSGHTPGLLGRFAPHGTSAASRPSVRGSGGSSLRSATPDVPVGTSYAPVLDLRGDRSDPRDRLPRPRVDLAAAREGSTPRPRRGPRARRRGAARADRRFDHVDLDDLVVPDEVLDEALDSSTPTCAPPRARHRPGALVPRAGQAGRLGGRARRRAHGVSGTPIQRVGVYVPGRQGRLPVDGDHDGRPGPGRRGRGDRAVHPADRHRRRRRPTAGPTARSSPPPSCSASTGSCASVARRRSPRWPTAPTACPPATRSSGPGNLYVALAKQQLAGRGRDRHRRLRRPDRGRHRRRPHRRPADRRRRPRRPGRARRARHRAADHPDEELVEPVEAALEDEVAATKHRERIEAALAGQGTVALVDDIDHASRSPRPSPPSTSRSRPPTPRKVAERIRYAGTTFIGRATPRSASATTPPARTTPCRPRDRPVRRRADHLVVPRARQLRRVRRRRARRARADVRQLAAPRTCRPTGGRSRSARARADGGPTDATRSRRRRHRPRPRPRPTSPTSSPYGAPQLDVPVRLNTNETAEPPPPATSRRSAAASRALELNRYPDRPHRAAAGARSRRSGSTPTRCGPPTAPTRSCSSCCRPTAAPTAGAHVRPATRCTRSCARTTLTPTSRSTSTTLPAVAEVAAARSPPTTRPRPRAEPNNPVGTPVGHDAVRALHDGSRALSSSTRPTSSSPRRRQRAAAARRAPAAGGRAHLLQGVPAGRAAARLPARAPPGWSTTCRRSGCPTTSTPSSRSPGSSPRAGGGVPRAPRRVAPSATGSRRRARARPTTSRCGRRPRTSCCAHRRRPTCSTGCSSAACWCGTSRPSPASRAACASRSARPRRTTRSSPRWRTPGLRPRRGRRRDRAAPTPRRPPAPTGARP